MKVLTLPIICGNDLLAIGAIKECEKLNIRVPEDVSIIGYDNLPTAETTTPPLTTINQDRLDLGKNSYAALYWLIAKVPISRSLLRPQLIIRSSTGTSVLGGSKNRQSNLPVFLFRYHILQPNTLLYQHKSNHTFNQINTLYHCKHCDNRNLCIMCQYKCRRYTDTTYEYTIKEKGNNRLTT